MTTTGQENTVIRSRTTIKTANAARYLTQLSKHWGHKFDVTHTDKESHIPFSETVQLDMHAQADELSVQIDTPSEHEAQRMEGVFTNHIVRFAFRETLTIDWQRESRA